MSASILTALTSTANSILEAAIRDHTCRLELRRFAEVVLDAIDASEAVIGPPERAGVAGSTERVGESEDGVAVEDASSSGALVVPAVHEPVAPVANMGQGLEDKQAASIPWFQRWSEEEVADIWAAEARCRLKAKGARWAATRRRLMSEGAVFSTDIAPVDKEIIEEARTLPKCSLWMCRPNSPSPDNLQLWLDISGCFDAVANVLSILRKIEEQPETDRNEFEQGLELLAEGQSALMFGIAKIGGPIDADQVLVHSWLRKTANERSVFIKRYMRLDDPADPSRWADLAARVESLAAHWQASCDRSKERRRLLGKVRHKVSLLSGGPSAADEHWTVIAACVDDLLAGGLPPSNKELREALLPVLNELPAEQAALPSVQLVLREIEGYLASRYQAAPETDSAPQRSPEIEKVAGLLAGRSLVFIGGDCRHAACKAIKDAFGLRELYWIETSGHESIAECEPFVARQDVAAVLLAIRWVSHSYGGVMEFCQRYGKPLARLPGGYNPAQVAAQIIAQCSERLAVA